MWERECWNRDGSVALDTRCGKEKNLREILALKDEMSPGGQLRGMREKRLREGLVLIVTIQRVAPRMGWNEVEKAEKKLEEGTTRGEATYFS